MKLKWVKHKQDFGVHRAEPVTCPLSSVDYALGRRVQWSVTYLRCWV